MKKLISRALTLVVIAGTISNTTNCLPAKAISKAVQYEKRSNTANINVAAARDKQESAEAIAKKEEVAKKAADEARTWLDSVKELSTSTKLLLGTIATTGALVGIDYGIAKYTGERMKSAKALEAARAAAKPYVENVRQQASKAGQYISTSRPAEYIKGSRVNPWNWRKSAPAITEASVAPMTISDSYYNDQIGL